jgi:hypothetical protein
MSFSASSSESRKPSMYPSEEYSLGVVHHRLAGDFDGVVAEIREEVAEALSADPSGRDLCLDVAHHHIRHADVVLDELPSHLVALAALDDLHRVEPDGLAVGVDRFDNAGPWLVRTDVEVVGGRHREGREVALVEHWDDHGEVRRVAGPVVGVVVEDDVALLEGLPTLLEEVNHAPNVSRDGSHLERCAVGFGDLAGAFVQQCTPEVLRLPDD